MDPQTRNIPGQGIPGHRHQNWRGDGRYHGGIQLGLWSSWRFVNTFSSEHEFFTAGFGEVGMGYDEPLSFAETNWRYEPLPRSYEAFAEIMGLECEAPTMAFMRQYLSSSWKVTIDGDEFNIAALKFPSHAGLPIRAPVGAKQTWRLVMPAVMPGIIRLSFVW